LVRCYLHAGCRRSAFHPMRICQARTRIPCAIPRGIATMSNLFRLPRRRWLSSDAFLWGLDLFNHGYYWEAHEAWEGLWQVADRDDPLRTLFKGLILLSAAGVKIRERKNAAAARHAMRAAALLRQLMKVPDRAFERALGMSPAALAECAEVATRSPAELQATAPGQPQPVFNFILGPTSRGSPSGSQKRNGHL
jgi:predicted metal-dependent hydrolase